MKLSRLYQKEARPAFTLVELLVGMAISLIVAGVISSVFLDSWKAQTSQETYAQLQQKSRSSVDEISSAVQSAGAVVVSVSSGGNTYQSTASTLVLRTPSISDSGEILSGTDYLIFRQNPTDSTILERIIIADGTSSRASLATPTTLNNSTATLTFTYYNGAGTAVVPGIGDLTSSDSIGILVDSQKVANGRTISRQIDNRVYLRNN